MACGDDDDDNANPTPSTPDGSTPDAASPNADGSVSDGSSIPFDSGSPTDDGAAPDAASEEAGSGDDDSGVDATAPDASDDSGSGSIDDAGADAAADSGAPDASTPDASTPDASTPDASAPDASAPDASVPDAGPPPDTTPPDTTLLQTPPKFTDDSNYAFTFAGTDADDHFECTLDGTTTSCVSPVFGTVSHATHTFSVRAIDPAGNADPTPATFTWSISTCGDGVIAPNEECDDNAPLAQTCANRGYPNGMPSCTQCRFDPTGCIGDYVSANTNFTGRILNAGLQYYTGRNPINQVTAVTEANGLMRTASGSPYTTPVNWTAIANITNPNGRALTINPNGPNDYYLADPSTGTNGFRIMTSSATPTVQTQSIVNGAAQWDLYAVAFRPTIQVVMGGWDATLGATVLHGNPPGVNPHFVGPTAGSVTGTPKAFTAGLPSTQADIYVAVYGQTPAGTAANGGIFWACDLTTAGGGHWQERDNGIPDAEKGLVWNLQIDGSTINTGDTFDCNGSTVAGRASTYYAALDGGGSVYKTTDAGQTWKAANKGLPAGVSVYELAIDCNVLTKSVAPQTPPFYCQDANTLYAATSAGLYVTNDAATTWKLIGFPNANVRGVTLDPNPTTTPPHAFVLVDDANQIYQSK